MPRAADLPLPKKEARFVSYYVSMGRNRTLERAAELAGFKPSHGKTLYRREKIREEIDRQLKVIEAEVLSLVAQDQVDADREDLKEDKLNEDFLDSALREIIQLDKKEHGRLALDALKTGYVRKGIIQMGNAQAVAPPAAASTPTAPGFYTAETFTTTRMHVSGTAPAAPAPAQATHLPPPPDSTEEILDAEVVEAVPEAEAEERVWNY